jgi:hypothetical protein
MSPHLTCPRISPASHRISGIMSPHLVSCPRISHRISHDQLGNLLQTAAPLGRTTSSTFDGNSNKVS